MGNREGIQSKWTAPRRRLHVDQKLIGLPDCTQFTAGCGTVLLDEDLLDSGVAQRIEMPFPIGRALSEVRVLGEIAGEGRRERSDPLLDVGKFEAMRILFEVRIGVAAAGDEIAGVEFDTDYGRISKAQHFVEGNNVAALLRLDVVVVVGESHARTFHARTDEVKSLRAPAPIFKTDVLERIA